MIYGAGDNGKQFYEKIKKRCKVEYFIDSGSVEQYYGNIPIVRPDKYIMTDGKVIVVTPSYAFEQISLMLQTVCNVEDSRIISIETILRTF